MILLGVAILIFILGLLLFQFPPKKMNFFYGYRTPRAYKSQLNWDFAQKYAGIKLAQSAGVLIILALFLLFMDVLDTPAGGVGLCICLILGVFYPIYTTEKALKSFDDLNAQ